MTLYIVGYGTLLYRQSLGDTIGQGAAGGRPFLPVIVYRYRRLFNLRPDHYRPSSLVGRDGAVEAAAMNIEPAPDDVYFNGLAFAASRAELAGLDKRESYYARRPVPMMAFESGEPLGEGQVYVAPPDSSHLNRDPAQLLPLWRDIEWARAGAYGISPAFGRMFDETTYLADGRTLMRDYYARWLTTPPADPAREEGASNG